MDQPKEKTREELVKEMVSSGKLVALNEIAVPGTAEIVLQEEEKK